MTKTVLILGANGRFGRNAADAFGAAGWTVRRFNRSTDTLMQAAKGVHVIVAAWNPPYQDWAQQVSELHRSIRQAALAHDATVVIPGNVYVFGPEAPRGWDANTPHLARNPLGRIRIDMEAAYKQDGVRTILLRAGDFLDTERSGNWFDQVMIKRLHKDVFSYPGDPTIAHAWAYLPDLSRAAVELCEQRDTLPQFADIPFPGFTVTGEDLVKGLRSVTGRDIVLKNMAWWPLRLAQPFVPMIKHLFEMRYLWTLPHHLDGQSFHQHLPGFQTTPLEEALRAAIAPRA